MPFHMKVAYAFHKFQASWDIQVRRGLNATKEILFPSAHDVINEQYSLNHIHICEIQSLTDRIVPLRSLARFLQQIRRSESENLVSKAGARGRKAKERQGEKSLICQTEMITG